MLRNEKRDLLCLVKADHNERVEQVLIIQHRADSVLLGLGVVQHAPIIHFHDQRLDQHIVPGQISPGELLELDHRVVDVVGELHEEEEKGRGAGFQPDDPDLVVEHFEEDFLVLLALCGVLWG